MNNTRPSCEIHASYSRGCPECHIAEMDAFRQSVTDALAALRESIGINGAQALAHIDTTIAALGLAPEEDK